MKTELLPDWIWDYDKANHQSLAGKAIRILLNHHKEDKERIQELEKAFGDLLEGLKNETSTDGKVKRSAYVSSLMARARKLMDNAKVNSKPPLTRYGNKRK